MVVMGSKLQSSNFVNEDLNPCFEETKLSQKCLEENLYDYKQCTLYFENYRLCKKFWGKVRVKRRAAGISPDLPNKEEREQILKLKKEGINVISAK